MEATATLVPDRSARGAAPGAVHQAPNPAIVAAVFMVLFLAGLFPVTNIAASSHFPSPLQPPEEVVAYFRAAPGRVGLCALLQFGSAVPLAIYAATMTSRLRFHGIRAAGVSIALFGGVAATSAVAISSLLVWVLAQPGIADDAALTRALHFATFAIGGPGYSVPLGLLFAGIAVTGGFARLLPRWLVIWGLALAAVGELSFLSLSIPSLLPLIPLTRFPGFVFMIVAGAKLPRRRRTAAEPG